jgi:hypothetical protein
MSGLLHKLTGGMSTAQGNFKAGLLIFPHEFKLGEQLTAS